MNDRRNSYQSGQMSLYPSKRGWQLGVVTNLGLSSTMIDLSFGELHDLWRLIQFWRADYPGGGSATPMPYFKPVDEYGALGDPPPLPPQGAVPFAGGSASRPLDMDWVPDDLWFPGVGAESSRVTAQFYYRRGSSDQLEQLVSLEWHASVPEIDVRGHKIIVTQDQSKHTIMASGRLPWNAIDRRDAPGILRFFANVCAADPRPEIAQIAFSFEGGSLYRYRYHHGRVERAKGILDL